MTTKLQDSKILIVGAGLIGTSIALGLKTHGMRVFLDDHDLNALESACAKSAAEKLSDDIELDLVVVATPPNVVSDVIRQIAKSHPNAVITDVASVKGSIFADLAGEPVDVLRRIVGGHPMAGREVSGSAGAKANLFVDRPWVITRNSVTDESAFELVNDLALTLGAMPIQRSSDEHDKAVALISHTPQVVASVLASQLIGAPDSHVEMAGQGIRDTIRIAASDSHLWSEILTSNAEEVVTRVNAVADGLHAIALALSLGDVDKVASILAQGNLGQQRLPGKHGSGVLADATVLVRLADKPGELARLFAVAAKAEVNLEDVRIDHSLGRMTGLVELTVAKGSAAALESALEAEGFSVIA